MTKTINGALVLKPCPFCGERNETAVAILSETPLLNVECGRCGAYGPCVEVIGPKGKFDWNTRFAPDGERFDGWALVLPDGSVPNIYDDKKQAEWVASRTPRAAVKAKVVAATVILHPDRTPDESEEP